MELDLRVVDAAKHFFIEENRELFEMFLGRIIANIINGVEKQEDVIARAAISEKGTAQHATSASTPLGDIDVDLLDGKY